MTRILLVLVFVTFSMSIKAEVISKSIGDFDFIYINGDIEKGDMRTVVNLPIKWEKTFVLLNSDGGSAFDAITISAFLATKGVITSVLPGQRCFTECALIWLSGKHKVLSDTSSVGFKSSSFEINEEEKQIIGPMFLGENYNSGVDGIGFLAVTQLLQQGLGLDLNFVMEFLTSNDTKPRQFTQDDFNKYNIQTQFSNDDSGEFRNALKNAGILSE